MGTVLSIVCTLFWGTVAGKIRHHGQFSFVVSTCNLFGSREDEEEPGTEVIPVSTTKLPRHPRQEVGTWVVGRRCKGLTGNTSAQPARKASACGRIPACSHLVFHEIEARTHVFAAQTGGGWAERSNGKKTT